MVGGNKEENKESIDNIYSRCPALSLSLTALLPGKEQLLRCLSHTQKRVQKREEVASLSPTLGNPIIKEQK